VREWSAEGAAERAASHEPILAELRTWLPLTPATVNTLTVLVPGCGLGRLPWDLACAGYAAQGNEFSYFMLFASHFILNCGPDAANAMSVHPFVHNPSCHMTNKNMLRPVPFPDIPPSAIAAINPGADLSMTAGEFCEVYGTPEHAGEWDAVVTCFFLDTAPNVCEYVQVIHAALRPGGVWVNLGPLLWHWADGPEASPGAARGPDDRFGRSLELSYAEVVACVQAAGFTLRTERRAPPTTYAGDALSLMSVVYSPMLFTAVKEEARGAEGREAAPPKPA
jgi:carnosine N-methyltransferase